MHPLSPSHPLTLSPSHPCAPSPAPPPGSDGDLDAFVSREGVPNELLKNDGGGGFTRVGGGDDNGSGGDTATTKTKMAAWCDFNNDGFVDLAVANDAAANEIHMADVTGAGTFTGNFVKNADADNEVLDSANLKTYAIACGDLDGASARTPQQLLLATPPRALPRARMLPHRWRDRRLLIMVLPFLCPLCAHPSAD